MAKPPPPSAADERKRTFHSLDGLRGIAALAVVFRHIPPSIVSRLTPESYLAVDLFFVLSGFVLAHAYAGRLVSGLTPFGFMVARLIRLYPLYLAGTLLVVALIAAQAAAGVAPAVKADGTAIGLALVFLPALGGAVATANLFVLNTPAWSLFFELVINLVFALTARRLGPRLLGGFLAAGAVLLVFTGVHFGSLNVGYTVGNWWGGFGRVGFTFFAGVAMHRAWAAGWWPWLRLPAWVAAAAVVVLFVIPPGRALNPAYDVVVALLVMPALVLASARQEPPAWLVRPFATLGVASYAIYVLQQPLARWFGFLLLLAGRPTRSLHTAGALVWPAIIVGIALLVDRFYDVPVRARLTAAWRRAGGRGDYRGGRGAPR